MAFSSGDVLAEARTWLGTPWHHQASLKGVGCDCIGLVRGVAVLFVGPIAHPTDYSETWPLYRSEERLHAEVAARADAIELGMARPGDILLFGVGRGPAHHCGFLGANRTLIHCYREAGAVVEQMLTGFWRDKLRFAFRLPGIED